MVSYDSAGNNRRVIAARLVQRPAPALGQKRRFDRRQVTSGLPRQTDMPGGCCDVSKVQKKCEVRSP